MVAIGGLVALLLLLMTTLLPAATAEEAAVVRAEAAPDAAPPAGAPCGRPAGAHCDPLVVRKPDQAANLRFWVTEAEMAPNVTQPTEVMHKVTDTSFVAVDDVTKEESFPHSMYAVREQENFEPSGRVTELFNKELQRAVQRAHPTFDDERTWSYLRELLASKSGQDRRDMEALQDDAFGGFVDAGSFAKRDRPSWRHHVHTRVYDMRPAFAEPTNPAENGVRSAGFDAFSSHAYAVNADGDASRGDDQRGRGALMAARDLAKSRADLSGSGWTPEAEEEAAAHSAPSYRTWMKHAWVVANDTASYTTQTNENQQDRESTASTAVWRALEAAEAAGQKLCGDASQCYASVAVEARFAINRQVDCVSGEPMYPWTDNKETGEPMAKFGSSLTLATVRVGPHQGVLRDEVDPIVRQHAYSTALAANSLTMQMSSAYDLARYGDECFMVQRAVMNRFLQGVL
jgi:hypothetical protein